jgi:hypothetical protein
MKIKGLPKERIMALGVLAIAGLAVGVKAQPSISGSVELGYNYNLTINSDSSANLGHSYDAHSKTFTLNNAHLVVAGSDSASGLGYDVEVDAGSDAVVNSGLTWGANSGIIDLQEAYATYAFGPGKVWGIKGGKFATYEGIEVIEGGANPTITRGFLYSWAEPATHTGLEVSYNGGMWDLHLGAINGWDVIPDNNVMMSYLAKFGLNLGNPLALTVSTIIGPEKAGNADDMRMSFDVTGVTKAIPMTDLWFQGNYGMEDKGSAVTPGDDASWFGFTVQPLVHLNSWFGLGLRYEMLNDADGNRTGIAIKDFSVQNFSLVPTFWLTKNLTARAEFRMDMASDKVYADSDDKPPDSQMEVAADLIAAF